MSSFVHLRAHSQYSILDGSASIAALVNRAHQQQMTALALTDHGNLFGVVEFYKACKELKILAIIGCELYVAPQSRLNKNRVQGLRSAYGLTLLAKNLQGYHNLCKLSSKGYIDGFYYYPRVDEELLAQHKDGLICIAGAMGTRLAHEILRGTSESVQEHLSFYQNVFGNDYYLDIQRHPITPENLQEDGFYQESWLIQQYQDYIQKQEKLNQTLLEIAQKCQIKVVATNDIHYMNREDWRAHEILLNIQSGEPCEIWEKNSQDMPTFRIPNPKRHTYASHEYYFKSAEEMQNLFADLPEALENTLYISEQCKVEIDLKKKHYPVYVPPTKKETIDGKIQEKAVTVEEFLWELCEEGIRSRYTEEKLAKLQELFPTKDPRTIVRERLEYEMSIIVPKGMGDYLLIVWDFIHWAKCQGVPMGPGRGSGAGSIVLYLIGITDIEPLRFHLFFERFINPERISYPDIDVDICMDRRGEVIAYTLEKYGKENVAQIITFGTMKAKMALKDVGRVLSLPLARVNQIAKLIPDDLNITLDKALEKDHELKKLYETDQEVTRLLDLARTLEGSIRNTGIHAAGIIISGSPLTDLIPICHAKDSEIPVTQFSMKPVEAVGMLKVDFLGLKTLTAIQICVDAIWEAYGKKIDWVNLPLDDKATFALLNQGKTLGVFQLESGGMQDLARQLHLDRFEEIIAVGALYRPGPMDMIPSFINRKHGREPIEYDHPWMQEILAETYGIMVYQEQVMQIASTLANFTLGEGDVLRRAMGKKDMVEMIKQREKFLKGAVENQIDKEVAMAIFDKIEKFASYGFNKSHAAAYGYLSYVTAFLKANYPGQWMAALMTCDRDDLTKIAKFIREGQSMGIPMLPPDINEAGISFQATAQGIRFAMTGVKGVGTAAVEAVIAERTQKGPFKSFYEFFKRMDHKKIGKKNIENLVEAGCFDFTSWSRDSLLASIEPIYTVVAKKQKEQALGILSLFAALGDQDEKRFNTPPKIIQPLSYQEMLLREKNLLGFFLTGHPLNEYKSILQNLSYTSLEKVEEMSHETIFRSAFIIESIQARIAFNSQKKFAIVTISDGTERQEIFIWTDLYEEKGHLLKENQLIYALLQVDRKDELRLTCRWLTDLTRVNEEVIAACDKAYDKAKYQIERMAHMKQINPKEPKNSSKMATPKEKSSSEIKPFLIIVNADLTRLSHVLQFKQVFAEHRGSTPIQIQFYRANQPLAHLHIESKHGVLPNQELKEKLQKMKCVLSLQ